LLRVHDEVSRLHTSFVLGYHGCEKAVGEAVLSGDRSLNESNEDYDWLGPGVYFWESDPLRAWEWAEQKILRKQGDGCNGGSAGTPFVIGAIIDLGNCLDLMTRADLELLAPAYEALKAAHDAAGNIAALPRNQKGEDKLLRFLDCAVIKRLHSAMQEAEEPPFETVRGLFTEGEALYPGSGFKAKTHVQVAVRSLGNIKGYFRVPCPPVSEASAMW
jgi:hypothetical protein